MYFALTCLKIFLVPRSLNLLGSIILQPSNDTIKVPCLPYFPIPIYTEIILYLHFTNIARGSIQPLATNGFSYRQ